MDLRDTHPGPAGRAPIKFETNPRAMGFASGNGGPQARRGSRILRVSFGSRMWRRRKSPEGTVSMLEQFLSTAGKSNNLGFWITKEMVSVITPGILILLQLVIIIQPLHWADLYRSLNGMQLGGGLIVGMVTLSLSYVIGRIARQASFRWLGWLTEPPDSGAFGASSSRGRHRWSLKVPLERLASATVWRKFTPYKSGSEIRRNLEQRLGSPVIERFLSEFPVLERLLRVTPQEFPAVDIRGGAQPDVPVVEAFGYAKKWLKHEAPAFGTEDLELAINIVVSLFIPLLMLPATVARLPGISNYVIAATLAFSLTTAAWCMNDFRLNREREISGSIKRMIEIWEFRSHRASTRATEHRSDGGPS